MVIDPLWVEWFTHHNFRIEQSIFLGLYALVMILFGLSVIAQQLRRGIRPMWPMPGGWVGAIFLIAGGYLPLMMTILRINLLGWYVYGWQQTTVYFVIALISVSTIGRWWFKGLDDPVPWNGEERRSGRDRRRFPWVVRGPDE